MKLFWNFKNKLLSGRRRHQFQFSGQATSVCFLILKTEADCLSCYSLKGTFQFLEALLIAPNFAPTSNDLFLDIFKISLGSFGSNSCYIHFDVLQSIRNGFSCFTLFPIQDKGIGILSYLVSKLRWNCPVPLFMTRK